MQMTDNRTTALGTALAVDTNGTAIATAGVFDELSIQLVYTDATPGVKTAVTGTLDVSTVTCPAVAGATDRDYIIYKDTLGASWAIYLDKTGTSVAPTGALYTAIPAANKSKADISGVSTNIQVAAAVRGAFVALVGFTAVCTAAAVGDGTITFTSVVRAPCADMVPKNLDDTGAGSITHVHGTAGIASAVNVTDNTITIATHGYPTGLKVALTINSGTLPAGTTATNYYIIPATAGTVSLATSVANAIAGTAVDITDQGDATKTMTLTPAGLGTGTLKLQASNDGTNYDDLTSMTTAALTAGGNKLLKLASTCHKWTRVVYTAGTGALTASYVVCGRRS